MRYLVFLLLVVLSLAQDPSALVNLDQIKSVYNQSWYSGYLHPAPDTHMHYFFFPQNGSTYSSSPLLLWFNGGPGCSSLLGALYEHGPFIFADAFAIFIKNKFSWNTNANVLYIESPAQVGFSYMDTAYPTWTDDMVAELNLKTVKEFLKTWPGYKANELYIAGESYAGIYVPTLAEKIDAYNDNPDPLLGPINLRGFAAGNACTHPSECGLTTDFPTWLYKLLVDLSFLPQSIVDEAVQACQGQTTNFTGKCKDKIDQIDALAGEKSGMNIYDVYRICYDNSQGETLSQRYHRAIRKRLRNLGYGQPQPLTENPPCVDGYGIYEFLNDPTVRDALHISPNAPNYTMCTDENTLQYNSSDQGSYWVYRKLIPKNKYKIVVYSGDTDPAVPITGTLDWVNRIREELQLSTVEYWRPWYVTYEAGKQNAGNVWRLRGLNVVTFRGVGHMAPQWNQAAGLAMIDWLVKGKPI